MNISKRITFFLLVCFISLPCIAHRHSGAYASILENTSDYTDAEKLSRAVEYFQSGKYHEGEYERAIEALEPILSKLKAFAPHELAVYYYSVADSYFRLNKYIDAVPFYEKHTLLCYNNEKGDSLFRIGICYRCLGDIEIAQEYFVEALAYFRRYNDTDRLKYIERELERSTDN